MKQMPMEMRLDPAKSAVRYEKPALSSVDQKGDTAPRYIAYLRRAAPPEEWLCTAWPSQGRNRDEAGACLSSQVKKSEFAESDYEHYDEH
jgi:hypothetical protein